MFLRQRRRPSRLPSATIGRQSAHRARSPARTTASASASRADSRRRTPTIWVLRGATGPRPAREGRHHVRRDGRIGGPAVRHACSRWRAGPHRRNAPPRRRTGPIRPRRSGAARPGSARRLLGVVLSGRRRGGCPRPMPVATTVTPDLAVRRVSPSRRRGCSGVGLRRRESPRRPRSPRAANCRLHPRSSSRIPSARYLLVDERRASARSRLLRTVLARRGEADPISRVPALMNRAHVGGIEVDQPGIVIRQAGARPPCRSTSRHLDAARSTSNVEHTSTAVVRNHDRVSPRRAKRLDALLGLRAPLRSLELEGCLTNADVARESARIFVDDRRQRRCRSATFARGDEHHVEPAQRVLELAVAFLVGRTPHAGIGARSRRP